MMNCILSLEVRLPDPSSSRGAKSWTTCWSCPVLFSDDVSSMKMLQVRPLGVHGWLRRGRQRVLGPYPQLCDSRPLPPVVIIQFALHNEPRELPRLAM